MKNILLIILISVSTSSFSQVKIDTSEIKSIRYEWKLNKTKNDSTLNQILTEYKSGIYKEAFPDFKKEHHKFPFINIFESKTDFLNREIKQNLKVHYYSVLRGESKFFYDKKGDLDSIYQNYYRDSLTEWKYKIKKDYGKNGKLKLLINKFGEKVEYFYNLSGNLKRIEKSNDSVTFLKEYYKSGRIIKLIYRNGNEFTYKYDKSGRILERNEFTDIFYYNYSNGLLTSIDKYLSKYNKLYERTTFQYNESRILINKKDYKMYRDKPKLVNEYFYTYK
ncbi:hypothetical protein [Mangrovimonas xylaniphaga]|uniref:hypothetical protein n=1 Tax=Mangrovimonas xylaniphaga TaxID=1645915 RepID=UPI0006B56EA0|nr:hypothetical protein [Mangrovimonas xylaniphaga]